jgi:Protein of unknown function (DUF3311)
MSGHQDDHKPMRPVPWARLLLLLPFIASLWVATYNTVQPELAGIPFFYWYQLAWVLLSAIIVVFVYLVER